MDYSAIFARHFARLVGLLVTEGSSVDEQKVSLRAALQFSKEGTVLIAREDRRVLADGVIVSEVFPGVKEFGARLQAHGVKELLFSKDAHAVEVLGVARLLGGPFADNDGGRNFHTLFGALGCNTVAITTDVRMEARPEDEDEEEEDDVQDTTMSIFGVRSVLSQAQRPGSAPQHLIERLGRKRTAAGIAKTLDRLAVLCEALQREGSAEDVVEGFLGIINHEQSAPNPDAKRAYIQTVRRLAKPALLTTVARQVRKHPDQRERYVTILSRTGEEGALAAFRQIMAAPSLHERTLYLGVLRELSGAVPALVHALANDQWYMVRAAADILAELKPVEAEQGLITLLSHPDDRVRRSALRALAELGTSRAPDAIKRGLKDPSAQVRGAAAIALASLRDVRQTTVIATALEEEVDEEAQFTFVRALGALGGADAVQRLMRTASQDSGRAGRVRRTTSLRLSAIVALSNAHTPAAIMALKELAGDKDREVREAAQRALMAQRSTPSGSMRALTPSGAMRAVDPDDRPTPRSSLSRGIRAIDS
jgi:HEAT repeat protein